MPGEPAALCPSLAGQGGSTSEIEAQGRQEQSLLRLSVKLLIGLAAVGVFFGILTGSFAILFYGIHAPGSAVPLLVEGGSAPDFGRAVGYAAGMAAICLATGWRQRRRNRDLQSAFIALDVKSWFVSGDPG